MLNKHLTTNDILQCNGSPIDNNLMPEYVGQLCIDITNDLIYIAKTLNNNGWIASADKTELHNHSNKTILDGITADKITKWDNGASTYKLKGKTIVRFGDSITEGGAIVDETISALTGANIINVGVACARMTSDDSSQGYDGFSMTNLVFAYYNQKQGNENPWSYQESQNEITKGNGDDNTEILNRLKSIDFSQVDYVLISYGTNDFAGNVPLGGLDDSWLDETGKTFCGAVNFSVSMLLTMYPHLKIVFTSPTWRGRLYEDEITCDNAINSENLMLKHYVKSLKLLCEKNHVQFIDLFNIGINEFNHAQYLWDRLHFNKTGAALLGEYIANGLLNSSPMNEAEMITGDLKYLHTDSKTDLVAAINEVDVYAHKNIGAMENLQTTNKGNLVEAINELFISANNGKQLIASAIGEPLDSNDTFSAMSTDINNLVSSFKANLKTAGVTVNDTDKFKQLIDKTKNLSAGGIKIDCVSTLPETVVENQIVVITPNVPSIKEIKDYTNCTPTSNGQIIIGASTTNDSGSMVPYYIMTNDVVVTLYLDIVKGQFNDTIDTYDGYIGRNDSWVNFSVGAHILYANGYDAIGFTSTNNWSYSSNMYFSNTSTSIDLKMKAYNGGWDDEYAYFKNPIDLTNVRQVRIVGSYNNNGATSSGVGFVTSSNLNTIHPTWSKKIGLTSSVKEVITDVSSLNGKYYFGTVNRCDGTARNAMKITEFELIY